MTTKSPQYRSLDDEWNAFNIPVGKCIFCLKDVLSDELHREITLDSRVVLHEKCVKSWWSQPLSKLGELTTTCEIQDESSVAILMMNGVDLTSLWENAFTATETC